MMTNKAFIFDLDGVLIDSREIHFNALNLALSNIDNRYVITQEDQANIFEGLTTRSKMDILTKMRGLPVELHQTVWEDKQRYTAILFLGTSIDNELVTLFRIIKSRGILIGVASNSIRETLDTCLTRLGISSLVDVSLSNEDVQQPKPSPEIYNECMSRLGVSPDECVVVEDSEIGRTSAMLSGAKMLPVNNRQDVNFELIQKGIDYLEA